MRNFKGFDISERAPYAQGFDEVAPLVNDCSFFLKMLGKQGKLVMQLPVFRMGNYLYSHGRQ